MSTYLWTPSPPLASHTNPIWKFWQSAFFLFEIFNETLGVGCWLMVVGCTLHFFVTTLWLPAIMLRNGFQLIYSPQIEIGFKYMTISAIYRRDFNWNAFFWPQSTVVVHPFVVVNLPSPPHHVDQTAPDSSTALQYKLDSKYTYDNQRSFLSRFQLEW